MYRDDAGEVSRGDKRSHWANLAAPPAFERGGWSVFEGTAVARGLDLLHGVLGRLSRSDSKALDIEGAASLERRLVAAHLIQRHQLLADAASAGRRIPFQAEWIETASTHLEAGAGGSEGGAIPLAALGTALLAFYVSESTYRLLEPQYRYFVALLGAYLERPVGPLGPVARQVLRAIGQDLLDVGLVEPGQFLLERVA